MAASAEQAKLHKYQQLRMIFRADGEKIFGLGILGGRF